MILVLTGVPGSGKGKVIELVTREMDVSVLNFGDFMFRIAREDGLVKDRDDMRKAISIDSSRSMQAAAAKAIKSEIAGLGENVIVDTHCTIRSPVGFLPGLPFEVLRELQPGAIVVREVDPAAIVQRRNKDRESGARAKRDVEEVAQIALHQEVNRAIAASYATLSGAILSIVIDEDHEEHEFQNAERVAGVILDIFKFR